MTTAPPEITLDHDKPTCGLVVAQDQDGRDITCDLPENHEPPCSAPVPE